MPDGAEVAAASVAGAAHGQIASGVPGGISLSGHKLVDEGARALLLILPGTVRIDVRPMPDGLQVVPRPLGDASLDWEVDVSAVTDYGKTAEDTVQPALVGFRLVIWTEPEPFVGRLLLAYTRDRQNGPTHFAGYLVLQRAPQDS